MITKCTSLGSFLHAGVNTYKPETASADVIFALSIQIPSKIELGPLPMDHLDIQV